MRNTFVLDMTFSLDGDVFNDAMEQWLSHTNRALRLRALGGSFYYNQVNVSFFGDAYPWSSADEEVLNRLKRSDQNKRGALLFWQRLEV